MKKIMCFIVVTSIFLTFIFIYLSLEQLQNNHTYAASTTPTFNQIDGGYGHTVQIRNGNVYTWGYNSNGQLGIGNNIDQYAPQMIPSSAFSNRVLKKVQASPLGSGALTEDKYVYFWGQSIGSTPTMKSTGFPVRDFDMGGTGYLNTHQFFVVVSDNDGSVYTWGSAYRGQFGNGLSGYGSVGTCSSSYSSNTLSKVLISATLEDCPSSPYKRIVSGTQVYLTDVVSVSVSNDRRYTIALTATNDIYTWGESYGNFTYKNQNLDSYQIVKIVAGGYPLFLTDNGEVYYFSGRNGIPQKITLQGTTEKAIDIIANGDSILILTESKKLYGIGVNRFGQLGSLISYNGTPITNKIAQFTGITDVMYAGMGYDHTVYLTDSNEKYFGLGKNSYGQIANINDNSHSTFQPIDSLETFKLVHATNETSYAFDINDKLYSWGSNESSGLLLRGGAYNTPLPAFDFSPYGGAKSIEGFSGSYISGAVITGDNSLFNWGNNYKNGNGRSTSTGAPTKITNLNTSLNEENFNFIHGFQGSFQGIAVNENGKVFTWGFNKSGALGIGKYTTETVAGQVEAKGHLAFESPILPSDKFFTKVVTGYHNNYALTENGEVYSWGENTSNKLGYVSGNSHTPAKITSLPPIKDIKAGYHHVLFLDTSGDVWAIGANSFGQLGLGHSNTVSVPIKIPTLSNIKKIATGHYFSLAITESNELYTWGRNNYGQLGLGDRNNRNEPRKVQISNIADATGGSNHTVLLTTDGKFYSSGSDANGQLGLSQSQVNEEPSEIIYKPLVTLDMTSDTDYETDDVLVIKGDIVSENIGTTIQVGYRIEGNTVNESGLIEEYITTSTPHKFSKNINLTSSYPLGGYTLYVIATISTGLETVATINFSILDKTFPTLSISPENRLNWGPNPVTVTLNADDNGGSGYRGIRYVWTKSEEKPTSGWSPFDNRKTFSLSHSQHGTWYLHSEAIDNTGNITYLSAGPYLIGEFTLSIPKSITFPSITLDGTIKQAKSKFLPSFEITETTDRGYGWNLSVKGTLFKTEEGLSLPANSLSITFPALASIAPETTKTIDNNAFNSIYNISGENAYGIFLGVFDDDSAVLSINPATATNRNHQSETFTSTLEWVLSSSP